jgi:hypothetical protein
VDLEDLPFEGGIKRLREAVVSGRADCAHGLGDPEPAAQGREVFGGVLGEP